MNQVEIESNSWSMKILVCSSDASFIQIATSACASLGAVVEICVDSESAIRTLLRSKSDALIVDSNCSNAPRIINHIRETLSNRRAVVFGVMRDDQECLELRNGATFIFSWPPSVTLLKNGLRAAYPLMSRERRRYFRCPVTTSVVLVRDQGRDISTQTYDVSENGLAVQLVEPLPLGSEVRIRLSLPGVNRPVEGTATVRWLNAALRGGLQFVQLNPSHEAILRNWLDEQIKLLFPALSFEGAGKLPGQKAPPNLGGIPDTKVIQASH